MAQTSKAIQADLDALKAHLSAIDLSQIPAHERMLAAFLQLTPPQQLEALFKMLLNGQVVHDLDNPPAPPPPPTAAS